METQSTPDVIPANAAAPVEILKVAVAELVASGSVRRWRARVFQIYLVVAAATFAILVVLPSAISYFTVDLSITRSVQTIHAAWFASFMEWVSFPGYTLLKPSFARTILLAILGGLVALMSISRIYVRDHWASDVFGASLSGSLWLRKSRSQRYRNPNDVAGDASIGSLPRIEY